MYAVIRAGGKQYRVAPGDVVKIEKTSNSDQKIEFEVLAVSGEEGKIAKAEDAKVVGEVLGEGRADKILVFHFKRKKQYKKLNGHRQPFTQVRIAEISVGGETFKAPEVAVKAPKAAKSVTPMQLRWPRRLRRRKPPRKRRRRRNPASNIYQL